MIVVLLMNQYYDSDILNSTRKIWLAVVDHSYELCHPNLEIALRRHRPQIRSNTDTSVQYDVPNLTLLFRLKK